MGRNSKGDDQTLRPWLHLSDGSESNGGNASLTLTDDLVMDGTFILVQQR